MYDICIKHVMSQPHLCNRFKKRIKDEHEIRFRKDFLPYFTTNTLHDGCHGRDH